MNFLAHFFLCSSSEADIVGSMLGDFVKGRDYTHYEAPIQTAILLHRRIDSFTDRHPIHQRARARLEPPFRRYAGILLDIWFDHYLARHWSRFSEQELTEFIARIYAALNHSQLIFPAAMQRTVSFMCAQDWLGGYVELSGVERALRGLGGRLQRANPLAQSGSELRRLYEELEKDFLEFFPALIAFCEMERPVLTGR